MGFGTVHMLQEWHPPHAWDRAWHAPRTFYTRIECFSDRPIRSRAAFPMSCLPFFTPAVKRPSARPVTEQSQNGALVDARHATHGAHAHSFDEEREDARSVIQRRCVRPKGLWPWRGKRRAAGATSIPLDVPRPIRTEARGLGVRAFRTSHDRPACERAGRSR